MNALVFDFECTISNKGNPFDSRNYAVCLALKMVGEKTDVVYDLYSQHNRDAIQYLVDKVVLLIAFNAKFDLHWLRKIGINFDGKLIWDCQLGEFILNNQKTPYPSLEQAAVKYGFGGKLDVVKTEYWDNGINTDDIPRDVLTPYAEQDVILTEQVYLKQKEQFSEIDAAMSKYSLFKLQCLDLMVLEEIEWNGIRFDAESALILAEEIKEELDTLYKQMVSLVGNIPFNLNSGDHISAILYGGTITIDHRIPVGEYKSGEKIGQTRYKILEKRYDLPRLVEPLEKTEVKKPAGSPPVWKTNETVLKCLKLTSEAKQIVAILDRYSEREKLCGTYLVGWSELIDTMGWEKDTIHGNLNQCVAISGRLSSSKPNLQNADKITKTFMVSVYEE